MRTFLKSILSVGGGGEGVLKVFLGGTADERSVIDGSDKCATVGVPRVVA